MIAISQWCALERITKSFCISLNKNKNNNKLASTLTSYLLRPISQLLPEADSLCTSASLPHPNVPSETTSLPLETRGRSDNSLIDQYLLEGIHCRRLQIKKYNSKRHYSTFKTLFDKNPVTLSGNKSYIQGRNIMAKIISGREVSDQLRKELKLKVESLSVKPKLAIVQVGGREDSNVYIKMKIQFAESIGATAHHIKLSKETTQDEVASKVKELNEDSTVHGIITQLPFDSVHKIDSDAIVNTIDPKKDVDGLCVYNAGKLSHGELNSSSFIPCTPNGCMELIKNSGIKVEGTRSVVIGRSKIVGAPMSQLLLWHDSTVTTCHSRTKNIEAICRDADIIVAAVGRPRMVKGSWLKPGAVVIDCGINVIPDSTKKSGTRLVGDVDFDECKEIASAITPVPGGVGPMTVAMLISNTVEAAKRASS